MKYLLSHTLFLLVLFTSQTNFAQHQGTFKFEGFFNGTNLNIQCRTQLNRPWYRCKCIDSVKVNGKVIPDIVYEGVQVDIANKVDLNMYDPVEVVIFFQKPCEIRTINSYEFFPKNILPVTNVQLDENNMLTFDVQENYPDLRFWVQIEQYKWGDWTKIGSHINITDEHSYQFDLNPHLIRGTNQFRATMATITQDRIPSEVITVKAKVPKVKFKYKAKEKTIYFSDTTHFELLNENSAIANKGVSNQCSVEKLGPGKYLLLYADKEKWITIK